MMMRYIPKILILQLLLTGSITGQASFSDSLFGVWKDHSMSDQVRLDAYMTYIDRIDYFSFWNYDKQHSANIRRWARDSEEVYTVALEAGHTELIPRLEAMRGLKKELIDSDHHAACSLYISAIETALEISDLETAINLSTFQHTRSCVSRDRRDLFQEVAALVPEVIERIEKSPDKYHSIKLLNSLGFITREVLHDYPACVSILQTVKYLYDKYDLEPRRTLTDVYVNLGHMLFQTGNPEESKDYIERAIKLSKSLQDTLGTGYSYAVMGKYYIAEKDTRNANLYIDSAIFVMKDHLGCAPCVVEMNFHRGEILNLEKNYSAAIDTLDYVSPQFINSRLYAEYSVAHHGLGNYKKAGEYAHLALDYASTLFDRMKAYELLCTTMAAVKKYELSSEYCRAHVTIQDSITRGINRQEVTRLELKNQFEQSRLRDSLRTAQLSREREIAHQTELSQQRATRNLVLVIGILILIIAAGLFYRLKHIRRTHAELERKNKLIEAEKEKARASERAKQQFLANMSHEIRTPINAIKGMTDILRRRDPRESQLKYLDGIQSSSNTLLTVINDILDISKVEAGKVELEKVPLRLDEVISDVLTIMQFKADEKGLELISNIKESEQHVLGDPVRLKQILINLIGNAIKFTEKGVVAVRLETERIDDDKLQSHIMVSDTGIGMEEDKLERIFNSFEQGYSDTTRKFGGSGLGLSICKKLAELHGGSIRVESKKAQGSTFHVLIPYPITNVSGTEEAPRAGMDRGPELKGLRILLVEDNTFNALVAQEELEDAIQDVRIDVAENGAIAVEKIMSNEYDVVLMDVQMPVMNGYDATMRIRGLESAKAGIPIIAMTANVMKNEVDRCFRAGMDDFVGKPFQTEDLLTKIFNLTRAAHLTENSSSVDVK